MNQKIQTKLLLIMKFIFQNIPNLKNNLILQNNKNFTNGYLNYSIINYYNEKRKLLQDLNEKSFKEKFKILNKISKETSIFNKHLYELIEYLALLKIIKDEIPKRILQFELNKVIFLEQNIASNLINRKIVMKEALSPHLDKENKLLYKFTKEFFYKIINLSYNNFWVQDEITIKNMDFFHYYYYSKNWEIWNKKFLYFKLPEKYENKEWEWIKDLQEIKKYNEFGMNNWFGVLIILLEYKTDKFKLIFYSLREIDNDYDCVFRQLSNVKNDNLILKIYDFKIHNHILDLLKNENLEQNYNHLEYIFKVKSGVN